MIIQIDHHWKQTVFLEPSCHVSWEECAEPCLNKGRAKGLFIQGLKIETVQHKSIEEDQKKYLHKKKKSSFKQLFPLLLQWYPEVRHFCRDVPIILIGCKTDLRKDKEKTRKLKALDMAPITYLQVAILFTYTYMPINRDYLHLT